MAETTTPDKTSSDYDAMIDYWNKIADMTAGVDAMRAAGEKYLPRFESESFTSYDERRSHARYTNIYSDIVGNLSEKPFAKEIIVGNASSTVMGLAENIDGRGNNVHNFSATFFRNAMDYGIDWIYVDYTRTNPNIRDASGNVRRKSLAEERQSGARPYWVRVPAREMIAVYSAMIDGEEEFVHCRMREVLTERAGWDEVVITQIREISRDPVMNEDGEIIGYDDAYFRVWQEVEQVVEGRVNKKKTVWSIVDEGPITIGLIPITPLVIGERIGDSWQIVPAMRSCAELQLEYYEEENGLKNIKKLTAFPMLTAEGVTPEIEDSGPNKGKIKQAPVGPRAVLYGPPTENGNGSWSFIEPAGTSLTFLKDELKALGNELRELGRQPLTQTVGQMTVTQSVTVASKGNAAIQRWALVMKDALENAFFYTALWLKDSQEPTVTVDTDFDLSTAGDDGFSNVLTMRAKGDLTRNTLWQEARRRRILGDEFNAKNEERDLDQEAPSEEDLRIAAGLSPSDDPNA